MLCNYVISLTTVLDLNCEVFEKVFEIKYLKYFFTVYGQCKLYTLISSHCKCYRLDFHVICEV